MLTLRRAVMAPILRTLLQFVHGANGRVVNTASSLLPNQAHLIQHFETVADHADFASLVMVPAHGDFFQSQARAKSQIKQLHVKPEAIDSRGFHQRPANTHAKGFETTLRVPERQTGRQADDEIENASTLFAPPWLMHPNQLSFQST